MDHAARLAVIEQKLKFSSAFEVFLRSLLDILNSSLETAKPSDNMIKIDSIKGMRDFLKIDEVVDYLKHIGYQFKTDFMDYEHSDSKILIQAKSCVQCKLSYLGIKTLENAQKRRHHGGAIRKTSNQINKLRVLATDNKFLLQIEQTIEHVMRYEDKDLQARARACVPLVMLEVRAMKAVRDQQREIKKGSTESETPFEMALLSELVSWYKTSFFRWLDRPSCRICRGETRGVRTTTRSVQGEICRVEVYNCERCPELTEFVRYNDPGALLLTRTGRCGEWANCFALLARALGYDARYVVDTTDHVWCEVYDAYKQRWVHVDPCEAAIDKPLTYEHGWGKRLEYVIAYSRDDVQDVTWRYSSRHKDVLSRRHRCTEPQLMDALFALRSAVQERVSPARRRFLQRRTVRELAEMMAERKPSDYENQGRSSGSHEWRRQRGELGASRHAFKLSAPGQHVIRYYPVRDEYRTDGVASDAELRWADGAWECDNMRRHVENDWKMVYLARIDGAHPGVMTWRVEAGTDLQIGCLTVSQVSKCFDSGSVQWSCSVDDGQFEDIAFDEQDGVQTASFSAGGRRVALRATLSGGGGDVSWQHAQLFRLPLASGDSAMEIKLTVRGGH